MKSALEDIGSCLNTRRTRGRSDACIRVYDQLSRELNEIAGQLHALEEMNEEQCASTHDVLQSRINELRPRWLRDFEYLRITVKQA